MNNKRKKVIIFESLRSVFYPLIRFYLARGYAVYFFYFDLNIKKKKWAKRLINNNKLKTIFVNTMGMGHGDAIDQTHVIYENIAKSGLFQSSSRLYNTDETSAVFKKVLLEEIFKCVYIHGYVIKNKEELKAQGELWFFPEKYFIYERIIKKYGTYEFSDFFGKIKRARLSYVFTPLLYFFDKLALYFAIASSSLAKTFVLVLASIFSRNKAQPLCFNYAIAVDQEFQIKFKGRRGFDFLIDDKDIKKNETIFLINIPVDDKWVTDCVEKGYNIIMPSSLFRWSNLTKIDYKWHFVFNIALSTLKIFLCVNAHNIFLRSYWICLRTYIGWELIFNQVRFKKYIYANNESPDQLALNILMRSHGCESWMYNLSLGGAYIYSDDMENFYKHRSNHWAFVNYDHFLGMNEEVALYHQLHHQTVKKYHTIGCVYSEMIKKIEESADKKEFIAKNFNNHPVTGKTRIVAVYDTTFIEGQVTDFDDGLCFYGDIIKLLNSMNEILLIVKPSKSELLYRSPEWKWFSLEKGRKLLKKWDELKADKRVFWATDKGDSPLIIAMSDLVITHCLSSPTAEALGARKKAFWYESFDKHMRLGVNYYRIPGLVIHGYDNLKTRVNNLLYEADNGSYSQYLDRYIKGKIEYALDAKAFTRFRDLIKNTG